MLHVELGAAHEGVHGAWERLEEPTWRASCRAAEATLTGAPRGEALERPRGAWRPTRRVAHAARPVAARLGCLSRWGCGSREIPAPAAVVALPVAVTYTIGSPPERTGSGRTAPRRCSAAADSRRRPDAAGDRRDERENDHFSAPAADTVSVIVPFFSVV